MTGNADEAAADEAGGRPVPDFLASGGGMGARMRSHDWSRTPLGSPETWPQSLRSAISICLGTRYPIAIYWGAELALLYNDAWSPIPGKKHPWALGRPGREVWPEIWDTIGPLYEKVQATGEGIWQEDQLLPMHRHGYTEECYFNFTFSPIRGEDGSVEGIFNAVVETTFRVISERRERALRVLAEQLAAARSEDDVWEIPARTLATGSADVPFCLLYRLDRPGHARLAGHAGLPPDGPASPDAIDAAAPAAAAWPLARVLATGRSESVDGLSALFGAALPGGPWPEPAESALVVPVAAARPGDAAGFLIAGISPRRALDEEYRAFVERAAAHVATALGNVRAYQEERRRAEALAEVDRAKTTFFSNVSHEFRTPLTLMLGPLEEALADAGRLLPEELERVRVVHRNGLRLLKLVNALLDFSRIEAGRAQASFEPTDLATLTAELASTFRSACEKAGLALVLRCPPLAGPVHVDRDMWEKIVLNLLSNAFKFTFEGEIAVEAGADGDAAVLTVRDTGTGVPAHELPRLFERFHRVEGARGRSYEGSGIGLALVQELVKLHGGTIRVESEEGRGTAFHVRVPFGTAHLPLDRVREDGAPASAPSSPAVRAQAYVEEALRWLPDARPAGETGERETGERETGERETGERAFVLLADDNADMRDYVRRLLAGRHDVEAVPDGRAALDAIRARRPDLLLTDIMMPRLDGFGLLRAVREDPQLADLPVIMLSARAGEEAGIEGRAAGADDYLVKPFSARELIARVDTGLATARLRREHTQALRRLNEALAGQVEERTRERDRVWSISRDLFVVCGLDGRYRTTNPAWTTQLGYAEGELIGTRFDALVHPEDRAAAQVAFERLAGGAVAEDVDVRIRAADGAWRWYSWTAVPEGDVFHAAGRDVTARKELEEQLRQAQKMEAVGKLTGGVAHDFNNLLQVIGGNLQLLLKDVAGNERAEQRLRNALNGVSRGSKLASHLLAFGRRQPLAPKVVNLGRLVRGLDDMLHRALGEAVEIETVVADGLWNTFVDVAQVENALLNLAINARDAMEGRGRLTIEAANASLEDAHSDRLAEVEPGQYVTLAITDTGCGIPPELMSRVFEPFFTTKAEGQGTGLGLSMVYGFVKQSGGHVRIHSEPGRGTTVRIHLPRTHRDEEPGTGEVEAGPVTGGSETVLVVEDDQDVRATVVEMLSDLGYRVLMAKDAQGALAIVESGAPVDLLFTDVVMPGRLRSPELARRARELLPGIAVLFTSGYAEDAIVHDGRVDDGIELLSKPYTREALARKLRHVLRNQRQRDAGAADVAAVAAATEPGPEPLRVLLVEDDGLIRFATAEMLEGLGHLVTEAGDAAEALALIETHPVDVLLTDIGLPGISGRELAARACQRVPGLRVVYASGYELPEAAGDGDPAARAVLLRKPYGEKALAEALAAATA